MIANQHMLGPAGGCVASYCCTLTAVLVSADTHGPHSVSVCDCPCRHQVPPVTWDETVAANAVSFIARCPLGHSGGPYGENLAWGFGNWQDVIDAW